MRNIIGLLSVIIILLLINLFDKLSASKLLCIECQIVEDVQLSQYPCCVRNDDEVLQVENCLYEGNHCNQLPCYTSSTSTPTESPCSITATPTSNRCPETGQHSIKQCALHRRIYPNPGRCYFDSDCLEPFNVCCFDSCYSRKICKTYGIIQEIIN